MPEPPTWQVRAVGVGCADYRSTAHAAAGEEYCLQIAALRVVESHTERFVCRREKLVLHARERLGVRVPRYVVAEVDLNQVRLLPNGFP